MKQVLQDLRNGTTTVQDVPAPCVQEKQLLIRTRVSLISAGTEKMLVEFGKAGWIERARQQPDKVAMVLDKIRTDGLVPTIEAVFNKLDQPLALGYCNVGVVADIGRGVSGFEVGARVASNGKHAETVSVPQNLCAAIPDTVSDDEAAFTVIGAIALQGVRLVNPTLGECVVVTGLGLIGLLTVQLLRAHGCRVLGLDFGERKLQLAREFGAQTVDLSKGEDPVARANAFSRGRGVDAVIVTAATKSSEPIHQAALMSRQRGRIVLVGVTGLELSRDDFFKKELSFQVSSSYGPGRYDSSYEEKGQDYPVGFVRWTAQRNFEAVLDMMSEGRLNVRPLISHRFAIENAGQAYELMTSSEPSVAILLEYSQPDSIASAQTVRVKASGDQVVGRPSSKNVSVSFIGAGNYATAILLPAFKSAEAKFRIIASANGLSGLHAARKFGFETATTDADKVFSDVDTNAVIIATRHNTHANFVCKALESGKHVFVEKPLALTVAEVDSIEKAAQSVSAVRNQAKLMVGFNRRFAPQVQCIASLLKTTPGPKSFLMTVNAGAIPAQHWTQDIRVGGGRIVGEACHFIDLLRFLAASEIKAADISLMEAANFDTANISLKFMDGSLGAIHYFANGSKSFPKERLEVFVAGKVLQLDNFRRLRGYGWRNLKSMNLWRQDKGQRACVKAFVNSIEEGRLAPIPLAEILEVARTTITLTQATR